MPMPIEREANGQTGGRRFLLQGENRLSTSEGVYRSLFISVLYLAVLCLLQRPLRPLIFAIFCPLLLASFLHPSLWLECMLSPGAIC